MNQMHRFFGSGRQNNSAPNNKMAQIMKAVSMIPQFMKNPIGAMMSCGLNIPENIQGNSEGMVNYLLNTGQMTREQYDTAEQYAQLAQQFIGKKF